MSRIVGRWALPALAAVAMVGAGCDGGEEQGDDFGAVRVVYGDLDVDVDLGDIDPVDIGDGEGEVYAPLDQVIAAASIGHAAADLMFDFVSADGFRPSDSSNCTADLVPVAGTSIALGYIHRVTRDLVWDESLDLPGCLSVDDTAEIHVTDAEVEARSVEVTYEGTSAEVDLGSLETVEVNGVDVVRLADVVEAAELGVALADLEFDFVASDGFRPGSSTNCAGLVPVQGAILEQGYIHPASRNLSWDESLDYPGCLRVDDVATIEAADGAATGQSVEVVYDGTSHEVDLSTLDTVDVGGAQLVVLADVVEAAELGVAVEDLVFDFVASDGFRPEDSSNCVDVVPLAGSALASGFIDPVTRDLSWDEALGLPGCMGIDDVVTIEASEPGVAGRIVEVVYGETTSPVDLSALATVDVEGTPLVVLADVIEAAELGVSAEMLTFDFVASDGFRPGDSPRCADYVPVPGSALASGWIDPASGDVSWDASLEYPGCLGVGDVVTIEATDVVLPGRTVAVVFEETTHTVDLSTIPTEDVGGEALVPLDDVVAAASLGVATADLYFDFVASDGFRPHDSPSCGSYVPVPGSSMALGWISPTSGDLTWDASLAYPGCLGVGDVVTIEAAVP